ncbi:MAG: amidohydrolase [Actinobacteria bacterium]|nr:amidohydrolase [Actinomycetota bacterium]
MARTRIEGLAHVVTVDEGFTILDDATIEITDGVITAITPTGTATMAQPSGETAGESVAEGTVVLDGRGKLALPGLVNLHTHLPMTLLRGLAENVDLQGFLAKVWAAEGAVMDPDTVRLGAELGALESLLAGVTTTLDMYFHHEEAHQGALLTGARHVGGPVFFDGAGPDGLTWEQRLDLLAAWPDRLRALDGDQAPTVPTAAMPHSTYTCSPEHLRGLAEVVATWPAEVRPLVHLHASENAAENADVLARHGASPTRVLADAGLLSGIPPLGCVETPRPGDNLHAPNGWRTVLGHGVHLDAADRALIGASTDASGRPHVTVAHCPGSNLKLASGALPWQVYRDAGVPLALGTDGCSSSNDLDLWATMRQAALLARLVSGDPTAAPAHEVIRAATIDGARALGIDDLVGSLEVGKRADLVLLDLDAPHLTPVHDVAALLVFAAGRGDVSDVFVDGRHVVQDRRSTLIDTGDLLARARARGRVAAAAAKDA